jgi:hypothetical protein
MPSECERLEREVGAARRQLQATLEELRVRVTPAAVLDGVFEYGRDGRLGEFLRNFGREVRENPLPLILIGIGAAWLFFAASRTARSVVPSTAESASGKATGIGAMATTLAHETSETAARLAERIAGARSGAGRTASEAVGRARDKLGKPEEVAALAAAVATPCDESVPAATDSNPERRSGRAS